MNLSERMVSTRNQVQTYYNLDSLAKQIPLKSIQGIIVCEDKDIQIIAPSVCLHQVDQDCFAGLAVAVDLSTQDWILASSERTPVQP